MLLLLFQLDQHRYALDARRIVELLPMVELMEVAHAPAGVAGLFNYRGTPVPAIDLSQVILGRPAQLRLHTRIVLVNLADDGGAPHLVGLIAERATQTLRRERDDFVASGMAVPHQGAVAADADGFTQWIELEQLVPEALRAQLVRPVARS